MEIKSLYWQIISLLLGIAAKRVWSTATKESAYYTAGVAEFRPSTAPNVSDKVIENLQAYLEIITSMEANATDIIVFPEATLNRGQPMTYVPAPQEEVIPCTIAEDTKLYEDFLVQMSCAARQVRKYLVINVAEKSNCPKQNDPRPCAANGLNSYNTNVVFDRDGRVIARYRKFNLFREPENTTYLPELATFETDFGVRFGLFICFDIMFYTPAKELVQHYHITDMIFSTMFYSELPFHSAIQVQQSWAWSNNVNVLAAGASDPQTGSTGSGIYAGANGALKSIIVGETGVRKLLVAQVLKMDYNVAESVNNNTIQCEKSVTTGKEPMIQVPQTGIKLLRDPTLDHFNSELLDPATERYVDRRLCIHDFCCHFKIDTDPTEIPVDGSVVSYKYRMGVFKGLRNYYEAGWNDVQICAVYACTNASVASCGEIFSASEVVQANFRFKSIVLEGNFDKDEKLQLMPNSLNDLLYPLEAKQVQWNVVDQRTYYSASYKFEAGTDNLLTFGIYANYFNRSVTSA